MNYKDTERLNPICRLFFKIDLLTDFAALCLTDFIDWIYLYSWLVFSTQFVNCCPHGRRNYTCVLLPLYLLSDLPPLPKLNVQYILLGPPGRTQAFPNLRPGLLNCWRGTERVKITRESNSSQDQPSVPHCPGE
jgi:hypothetical protein